VIPVTFKGLIIVYLSTMVGIVILAYTLAAIRRRRRERHALRHAVRCHFCALEFHDNSPSPLPECPRCGASNERTRFARL